MADILRFKKGVPEVVSLAYSEGRKVESTLPDKPASFMFTLVDGRRTFLPMSFAEQLRRACVAAREPIEIVKLGEDDYRVRSLSGGGAVTPPSATTTKPRTTRDHYSTATSPDEDLVPALEKSIEQARQSRGQAAAGPAPAPELPKITPMVGRLCSAMCALIDSMKEAKAYAQRVGIDLTNEDLRALANTAFIQASRDGGAR